MEKPKPTIDKPSSSPLSPRSNSYGTVFPGAFEPQQQQEERDFLRSFQRTRKGRDADLPTVAAGEWWRMGPEAQRAWLEKGQAVMAAAAEQQKQHGGGKGGVAAANAASAVVFKLRGGLLGTARVRYDKATGRFALAETPLLERNRLFRGGSTTSSSSTNNQRALLPALFRYPVRLARPIYAPLFCLRWVALRAMVLWRALRQFVLPSWPYLLLFTARAAYLLAACMLLTVLVDELLQPLAQGLHRALMAVTGQGAGATGADAVGAARLLDFRGYSLRSSKNQELARTWVERWSEPLVTGGGGGSASGV